MPTLGTRNRPTRASSKRNPLRNRPEPDAPVIITSVVKSTTTMTLTFNVPVRLEGKPNWTTNLGGVTVVSAALTQPNVVALTWSATIATATALFIGYRDPAIRGESGGYVSSNQFPV